MQELTAWGDELERMLREFPEARRAFHERAGGILKGMVDQSIGEAILGGGERLKSWQRVYVGSRGGYAAVRAAGSKDGFRPGPDSPGAITNYVNNGHRIRGFAKRPSQNPKRYRYFPRIHMSSVPGKALYQKAALAVEGKIIREAEQFLGDFAGGSL